MFTRNKFSEDKNFRKISGRGGDGKLKKCVGGVDGWGVGAGGWGGGGDGYGAGLGGGGGTYSIV